jgi:hypothetical protein
VKSSGQGKVWSAPNREAATSSPVVVELETTQSTDRRAASAWRRISAASTESSCTSPTLTPWNQIRETPASQRGRGGMPPVNRFQGAATGRPPESFRHATQGRRTTKAIR